MDYREYSKELLSRKRNLTVAFSSLKEELEALEREKIQCKMLIERALGEDSTEKALYEDRLINILVDLEDCRFRKSIVERDLAKIEKGMDALTDYHRDVINQFFVYRSPEAIECLTERWYKERATVYRDRTRALEEFTRCIYGVVQM